MIALSYGGGVQSVCLLVLIAEEALPRPDLIGIADTGREVGSTWEYLYEHAQPYLDRKAPGLKIEVVPHTLARVDLYDKTGLTLVPAYTRSFDGNDLWGEPLYAEGRKAAFCSGEWKRDVMERWLRLKGVKECDSWIGYSHDEQWRVKGDHRPWCHLKFPLIEKRVTREACARIIAAAGLPLPKKSRCWMCPHQTAAEWVEVKARPNEFAAAVALEKQINERDPDESGELFLYSGRVPLEMADFGKGDDTAAPARPCETGHCWT